MVKIEELLVMNIKRTIFKLYFKVVKAEGTPESIARGVAVGLATGLIIPIGLQTVPALALAVILKANKVLTWMFTCVTNPATVFFIYPIQCWIGSYLIFRPISFASLHGEFQGLTQAETVAEAFAVFGTLSWSIIVPFFAGGILFAVLTSIPGYWVSLHLAQKYQARKKKKIDSAN